MNRERALKVVLVVVGLLFSAGIYLLVESLSKPMEPELELGQMFLGVYITLGIFVLLAARNSSANRSMIAFAAWVESCTRRGYGGAGSLHFQRSRTLSDRGGWVLFCRGWFWFVGSRT